MFKVDDTVQDCYERKLWSVLESTDDGFVSVLNLDKSDPHFFWSFVPDSLRRVEIFTYYDLCAADQDARERGCDTPDVLSRIWQEENTLYDMYLCFTSNHMPIPQKHAWVHQARIIREVTA